MPEEDRGDLAATANVPRDEVDEEDETVHRTTYRGRSWKVKLSDADLEKYAAADSGKRYAILAKKARVIPDKLPPISAIGSSLEGDLARIRRRLESGELEGTRGPTVAETAKKGRRR